MAEKRQHRRHRRRLNVKFGAKDLNSNGFTMDVSQGGMFLVASQLLPLHSRLHVQIFLDPTKFVLFEVEVRRHKIVPAQLKSIERGGFGVRFLHPSEVVKELVKDGDPRFAAAFATAEEFKVAYDRELKHGGLFIATTEQVTRDAVVTVVLNLQFAQRKLELEATVVHVSEGDSQSPKGAGVIFVDKSAVAGFQGFLPK